MVGRFIVRRLHAFRHAFAGWRYVLKTQENAWLHAVASLVVVLLAIWMNLPSRDWAVLILTIGFVWSAEILNTALEAVVDLASPEKHPLAKVGKDVGAAAVLIAALASVMIGLLILGPPLYQKLFALF